MAIKGRSAGRALAAGFGFAALVVSSVTGSRMSIKSRNLKGIRMWGLAWTRWLVVATAMSLLTFGALAQATHDTDDHSANTTQIGKVDLGSGLGDIAFWGGLAVVARLPGHSTPEYTAAAGFSVVDISTPQHPVELSRFACSGGGWDVSVWDDLVFLSVDGFTSTKDGSCSSPFSLPYGEGATLLDPGNFYGGLKIVSIADPTQPVQVGSLRLPCSGSHTNTVVPDLEDNRLLIFAASGFYDGRATDGPAHELAQGCDMIVEVPLDDPASANVIGRLPFGQGRPQCHDMTAHLARKMLAAACADEFRLYDISDPAAPELISAMVQPGVLQHSVAFSNDGMSLVTGEEGDGYSQGGAAGAACRGGIGWTNGAIWFYDITIPEAPILHSYHALQRPFEPSSPGGAGCSAHNFNVVPTRGDRDILIAAWYAGGMSAIDFTDLDAPKEIAHYLPDANDPARRVSYWSAYWYRGYVYATNSLFVRRNSLDVYRIDDPAIGDTYRLPHLNPQSQETLTAASTRRA